MNRMDAAVRAASSVAGLLERRNVVGVGAGFKVKGGKSTDIPAVIVFVEKKMEAAALTQADLVPAKWKGVPTDVIETGLFRAFGLDRTSRVRPAVPGVSIGHVKVTAGTLGAVVVDKSDGRPLILSNNHVLANSTTTSDGRALLGDPILQPGPADGGRVDRDTIARLFKVVPFVDATGSRQVAAPSLPVWRVWRGALRLLGVFGVSRMSRLLRLSRVLNPAAQPSVPKENRVDAALASPVNDHVVRSDILGIGPVRGVAEPQVGLRVRKSGRTTGVTSGRIQAVNASVNVEYPTGVLFFVDQLVTTHLGDPGDSGSLVLDEQSRAVGLFFAGSSTTSLANPIGPVLDALGIRFPQDAQSGRVGA